MKGWRAAWLAAGRAGFKRPKAFTQRLAALLEHVFWIADDDLSCIMIGMKISGEAEFHAVKTCLGNADNGHLVIVESESLATIWESPAKRVFQKL